MSDDDDEIMTEMRNLTIKPAERGEIGMFAATSPIQSMKSCRDSSAN